MERRPLCRAVPNKKFISKASLSLDARHKKNGRPRNSGGTAPMRYMVIETRELPVFASCFFLDLSPITVTSLDDASKQVSSPPQIN